MTITKAISQYGIAQSRIKAKLDAMQSATEISDYLDWFEAEMIEIPYGDMLFEFACEYANACIKELNHAKL